MTCPAKTNHSAGSRSTKAFTNHSSVQPGKKSLGNASVLKQKQSSKTKKPSNNKSLKISFPVVGIGASAGGLEAFSDLLRHLPNETGMAFVCVQHLDPTHVSLLASILSKVTSMPVLEVTQGMPMEPNHVYVIPPNACLSVSANILKLEPRSESQCEGHKPIDIFFKSIAEAFGNRSIGVVLSGTASDGSAGVVAIKEAGGLTYAQEEKSAKFEQMPQNAIATDCIDFVLNPKKIAESLAKISRDPNVYLSEQPIQKLPPEEDDAFRQIILLLKKASGVDFAHYKPATIRRRVSRRMATHRKETLSDYLDILKKNPQEIEALHQDVLIKVTRFFRDPEIFKILQKDVFPRIVKNKSNEKPLRIWVPACSTGEEIYSLAILLLEHLGDEINDVPVLFFGSDIKDSCIAVARAGIYPESIAQDVSSERLKRFFNKTDRGYQITKSIRDRCIFAKQNVTADPPFSRIDLISCRNLLIYFTTALQNTVIPTFHYALNPDGFLLLGPSESAINFENLFLCVNQKAKIYSKKETQSPYIFGRTSTPYISEKFTIPRTSDPGEESNITLSIQKEADRVVVAKFEQAGVVVNQALEILQFRGDTSDYLKQSPGTPSRNLLKMAREGLLTELRIALDQVIKEGEALKKENIRIKYNNDFKNVSIEVVPLKIPAAKQRYFLISFTEPPRSAPESTTVKTADPFKSPSGSRARELEEELLLAKEELISMKAYMQSIIVERESSNVELQATNEEAVSSNEELQSLNEEMQSANEELQTAKEEIQASNEEITTVNDELNSRNSQLSQLNDDFVNLTKSIQLPVVIVGNDLRIRRFTPTAEKVFSLVATDVGRSISDIKLKVKVLNLEELISRVVKDLAIQTQEAQDDKGNWYNLEIRPYRTSDNKIDGAVMTFADINSLKSHQKLIENYRHYLEAVIQTVPVSLLVLDSQLRVKMANEYFFRTFKIKFNQVENRLFYEMGNNQWNIPALRKLFEQILPSQKKVLNYEVAHDFEHIGHKVMLLSASQIESEQLILVSVEDITDRKARETGLLELNEVLKKQGLKLRKSNTELEHFAAVASHDLREPFHIISMFMGILGTSYKNKLEPKAQELIKITEDAAMRAQGLISSLLDYARVDTEKKDMETVDVKSIVKQVLLDLRSQVEESDLEIACGPLPEIKGEALHLTRLFQNLISNAIKYRSPRPLKVHISASKENTDWIFQIKDNGIGFEPKEKARIFKMFKRLQGWEISGTGIGLATCKKIVERHGGKIWAESEPGKGTSFYFSIPDQPLPPPKKNKLKSGSELIAKFRQGR